MADSIASLRRKWGEAQARIRELEARDPEVVDRVVYVDKIVEVPSPERVVYQEVPVEVPGPERVIYRDVPGPVREVKVPVVKVVKETVEKIVEKPVPFDVVRVEYRDVIKEVEVPGPERILERIVEVPGPIREVEKLVPFEVQVPMYPPSVHRIEVIKEVYVDNPAHIAMIEQLQEKVCQFISQSDLSQNQSQVGQSSQGVAA